MGFEADGIAIAGLCEFSELRGPVDDPDAYWRPCDLAICAFDGVFDVTVVDAVFGE